MRVANYLNDSPVCAQVSFHAQTAGCEKAVWLRYKSPEHKSVQSLFPSQDRPSKTNPMKPRFRRAASLTSFLTVAVFSGATQASTLYWDGATPAGDPNGGAGNWDLTTANWDTAVSGGSAINWTDGDLAVFGGTAGTVTLTDPITVSGLRFDTTGYIINGETNAKTLTFASGNNAIVLNNIAAATINGTVGGSGNVILSTSNPATSGTLTLGLTSTAGWSGSTTINAGMTLLLNGANRGLSSTSGITLNGGGITLTNTNATQGAFNRVKDDAGITSNGGTFTYTNTSGASLVYAETLGSVGLNRGQTNFLLSNNMGAGNSQTLTLSDLTRTGSTNTSVVSFGSASGLNITTNIIQVTGKSGTGTGSGQIIAPWAFYGTTPSTPTDYAVYDASGRVLNASIGATAENSVSWTAGGNNVTLGAATTLTGTRTLNTLRTSGAATLNLGASDFDLETYGLLNGGTALTISTTGTGGLSTPTGGGHLYITPGAASITVSAPIKDNGGAVTLVKSGGNTLTLSSIANNYSGGTVINAGAVAISSDANLGQSNGGLTFNGTGTISYSDGLVLNANRTVTFNEGANVALSNAITVNGVLAGSGNFSVNTADGFWFYNPNNTFSGTITVGTAGSTTYGLDMASIGDSVGAGMINLGIAANGGTFRWIGAPTATTFNNRQFALSGTTGTNVIAALGGSLSITKDLVVTGVGNKTLTLAGTNTGTNTFAGSITNGTNGGTSVISLTKDGTGTWALGGTNTYTGDTNLAAALGLLVFQGSQSLSPSTTLKFAQSSSSVQSVRFLDDASGTINFNRPIEHGGTNTSQVLSIFVGNNNTANLGSGAGTTTGSTIQVGNITHTSLASDTSTWNLNATGANGYRLQTGTITLNNLVNRTAGATTTYILNPTTANMTVAAVTMAAGNAGSGVDGIPILRLAGTSLDNYVSGAISNSVTVGAEAVRLEKTSTSIWTLQGTNTYTGITTVSGGILRFTGDSSAATGAVSVTAGALGGNGGSLGGAVTVSSTGGIDLRDGSVGNLTLASTLGITGAANANNLSFDLGNNTGTSDQISVAGTTTVTTANSAVITLNQIGGLAGRNATTYTLIGGAGTLDAANFAKFTLATTKAFGQTYQLLNGGTNGDLQLQASNATAATPNAFWSGATNANWSTASNWKDALAGSALTLAPDYQTNVTFTATGAGNLSNQVDADFDINSLNFNVGGVTIASTAAKMLTIEATNANGNTAGSGINAANTTGTNTISAKVGLASSQTWTVASGGTLAVSGVISDFGAGYSLTKDGLGDLNLSGANTYSGATNINAGILRVDNASALAGTSGVSIASGASLFVRSSSPTLGVNQSLTLNGSGATGSGALVTSTSGTTTWNGAVSLGSNSLVLQGGGTTLNIGGGVSLGANTLTLETNGSNSATISGGINGSGGITKTGTSTLILSGANTYTGTTTVSAGTLSLAPSGNFLGGVFLASSGVTLNQGATLLFNAATTANAVSSGYSLASPITLAGGAGSATVRFGGNDQKYTLSGGVTGQSGVAQTLALFQGGQATTNGDRQDIVISGAIANGGSGGTLAVTVDFAGASGATQNAFVNFTGQNTFTGDLTVNNSKQMNAGSIYTGAWLTIGGERWVGFNTTPASSAIVGTGYLGSGGVYSGNIAINTGNGVNGTGITTLSFLSSANQTLNGQISGAGNFRMDGTGTLISNGDNIYTGTTTVSSGKLLINGNSSVANGAISVASGATLGGTGTTGGAVSVAGGATLSPGASIESLVTGALAMASGSTFVYEAANNGATGADLLGVNGALTLTSVNLDLTNAALAAGGWIPNDKITLISYFDAGSGLTSGFTGYADDTAYTFGSNVWTFNYNDTVRGNNYAADAIAAGQNKFVTLTLIPEPSTALLSLLGMFALLRRRR